MSGCGHPKNPASLPDRIHSAVRFCFGFVFYPLSTNPVLYFIMIGPGGLLLVVSHPICSSNFSFMGGVGKKQKKYKTKLGGEKYFCKVTY
jgi:hypothetical protein